MGLLAGCSLLFLIPLIMPLHMGHGGELIHQRIPRFLLHYITKYEAFSMRAVQYITTRDWIMRWSWAARAMEWICRLVLRFVNGEVLTLEEAKQVIAAIADHGYLVAVGTCPCRRAINKFSDDQPCNTDMVFGKWAEEYLHNYPECYEIIEKEEALRLVGEFDRHGYVHNLYGAPVTQDAALVICNCAPDVCVPLRVHCELDYPTFRKGRSLAVVDDSTCIGVCECGVCIRRCPFGARGDGADGKAILDQQACHGCGLCVSTCRGNATRLERKPGAELIFARNLVDP
jgi:NAD-dependent dihydropyrimidine dehydrogenase PreA subunit